MHTKKEKNHNKSFTTRLLFFNQPLVDFVHDHLLLCFWSERKQAVVYQSVQWVNVHDKATLYRGNCTLGDQINATLTGVVSG